ncbi:MAG TPA: M20/M25/M40 family metallo-hydrolase [bacterium]|nr:M20/M25/M40 family metallo-hydrolase [bacterium]HPN42868.1 M20/M25/M40 family metallo-hydrolase [bacterium]
MLNKTLLLVLAGLIVSNVAMFAGDADITETELKNHVYFLAADSLQGRKAGSEGGKKAAVYILKNLQGSKELKLAGEDGFQNFEVLVSTVLDFDKTRVSTQVAFAGYGLDFDADSISWHDYTGLDVQGRWVLLLSGAPDRGNPACGFAQHSQLHNKVMIAKDRGAAGVIFVAGEHYDKGNAPADSTVYMSELTDKLPVLQVKRNIADQLLSECGTTIKELEKRLCESKRPSGFIIKKNLTANILPAKHLEKAANVLAMLEGRDAELKKQVIVVGAHYDHVGYDVKSMETSKQDSLVVFNGADDNASGVASMLEIAEKLAALPNGLKRSVLFIAFDAEEIGRLGSHYFVNNPLLPVQDIDIMINLDMVGRLDSVKKILTVRGTGTAAGLENIIQQGAAKIGFIINAFPEGVGWSDEHSFCLQDIPVLTFHTGTHDDYHKPTDDADRINYSGMQEIAELACDIIVELGNRDSRLVFTETAPNIQPVKQNAQVLLGIIPDFAATRVKGLKIADVQKGRRASITGVKKGDIIVALDGAPVNNINDYRNRLSELRTGQIISMEIVREGERQVLIMAL